MAWKDTVAVGAGSVFATVLTVAFFFGIVIPIGQQLLNWLEFGTAPARDIYWLIADTSCPATSGQPLGVEGMDLCRTAPIEFTRWVGVDSILNFVCELHVAALTLVAITLFWAAALALAGAVGSTWEP